MPIRSFFVVAALLLSCRFTGAAQESMTLLFVGDVMQHQRQLDAARRADGSYRYDSCFSRVARYIAEADLAVANLETTLGGPPYSGYPAFCSPDELAAALGRAGFDLLATANNHSCDRRLVGIRRTLDVLDRLPLSHTGTFRSGLERDSLYPMIVEREGFRLALLNYTYDTNGIPIPPPAVVNLIDTTRMAADIEAAHALRPDLIIALMHWGEEYRLTPSATQRALADWLLARGVRLVIGSHPHVLQPMERRAEGVVVYSLGNYLSGMGAENTEIGAMVSVELIKFGGSVAIGRCGYRLTWVDKQSVQGERRFRIIPVAQYEQDSAFFESPWALQRMRRSAAGMRAMLSRDNLDFPEYTSPESSRPRRIPTLFRESAPR